MIQSLIDLPRKIALFFFPKNTRAKVLRIGGLVVVLGVIFVITQKNNTESTLTEPPLPVVTLEKVENFKNKSTFSVVGTVRAVSEAKLQAEAGGRITQVNVNIGDRVSAGSILGSIENEQERAQLLQAEGAYESAIASSLQSGISLDEAKTQVRNTYRDTFSTAEAVVRNLLDEFYSGDTENILGFKLTKTGNTSYFNETRKAIEPLLIQWSRNIESNYAEMNEEEMITRAESTITTISNLTANIALAITDEESVGNFSHEEIEAYETRLAGARASLSGSLSALSGAREVYEQAKLNATTQTISQSSARLKSALGALRSAQATYEKTLIRTPISGVVNALNITQGEYISVGAQTAIVANNGSLEISTALGEKDLARVHIGDTVSVNNTVKGTISQIAPGIDPSTGKSEVKISVDESPSLKNGSTVSVVFSEQEPKDSASKVILVPLKAIKMLASGSVVFGVSETNTLIAYPITLGAILGDSVEVTNGITAESQIITDARGRKEGDIVSVTQQ